MKRLLITAMLASAALSAPIYGDTMELAWDAGPPEDGPLEYTVQRTPDSDPTGWTDMTTTTGLSITVTLQPAIRNLYRLKITNANGQSVIEPEVYSDRPAGNANFRVESGSQAAIDTGPGDSLLAAVILIDSELIVIDSGGGAEPPDLLALWHRPPSILLSRG